MRKWLQDTYNGLYLVLLKPYMPGVKLVITLIVGILIGLAWAYLIAPVVFYDSDPSTLEQSWQDEWVKLLADRYAASQNVDLSDNVREMLTRVDNPAGVVQRLIDSPGEFENTARLQAILPLAQEAQDSAIPAPQPNNLFANIAPFIVAPLIMVILFVIASLLYGMFIHPNLVEPLVRRMRGGTQVSAEVVQARQARAEQTKLMEQQRTDFKTTDYGAPLMQRMSSYNPAYGSYDESYTIEDAQERFLGECGASVSESDAAGQPLAFDVWLFDKDDFVRTMTKVFVSDVALNDPARRASLESRGDLIRAVQGGTLVLETNSLRLQARIVDMGYTAAGGFEKMTLELAAWRKTADGAPADVPQAMPVQQAAPAVMPPSQQQFAPPPPPPAMPGAYGNPAPPPVLPPDDDDPFGGTGDFTPIR